MHTDDAEERQPFCLEEHERDRFECDRQVGSTATVFLDAGVYVLVTLVLGVARSKLPPWHELQSSLREVARCARNTAKAARELDAAIAGNLLAPNRKFSLWQQLMEDLCQEPPHNFAELADQLESLALPARVVTEMPVVPYFRVFAVYVQAAAAVFTVATCIPPSSLLVDAGDGVPFIEFIEIVWEKILAAGKHYGIAVDGPASAVARAQFAQRLIGREVGER